MSADTNDRSSVVTLTGVSKVYPHPSRPVHALREVDLFRRRRVGVMFRPVVSGATFFPNRRGGSPEHNPNSPRLGSFDFRRPVDCGFLIADCGL